MKPKKNLKERKHKQNITKWEKTKRNKNNKIIIRIKTKQKQNKNKTKQNTKQNKEKRKKTQEEVVDNKMVHDIKHSMAADMYGAKECHAMFSKTFDTLQFHNRA